VVLGSIKNELGNLEKYDVYDYIIDRKEVAKILKENKPIPSKLFLKGKYDARGKFIKLKSRVVAGGHRQKSDSYGRISSPTADMAHLMLVLALIKILRGKTASIDVEAAFLHAILKELIYMILPKDVVRFLNANDPEFREKVSMGEETVVVRLKKSLYGLKQASHNWNKMMTDHLITEGFRAAQGIDPCVFARGTEQSGNLYMVILHVDDLLMVSQKKEELD
jgi:hypothetical protein